MAVSFKNLITSNYSGKVGDIVLRNYGWKSVLAKRPDCSKVVRTASQLANESRFAKAVKSSQQVLKDPVKYEYYMKNKKKHQDVYHAAMSDCLTRLKVQKVDLVSYRGLKGNVIRISAWDKFKVETVSVMILNKNRQLIEKGPAVAIQFSGNREWDYIATVENVDYKSCRFLVRVKDRPGNTVETEVDIGGT
ncbi:MAG: hypothetical protein ABSD71_07835 [Bacteroidales bacterium]|jgi:hypothetical protein